uniref:histone H1.1-like n=1 Tax=Fragaria vesca subsp. vesca TaxID=101020 RepID=UPI0005CA60E6|nr:PREDICTED: histone H1.1-like [Fragaria vesca subsp. vesca]
MAAETAVVKAKRAPPVHPPFSEMITEAIVALNERIGSSQYAITKFMEEKHKQLPQSFRKLLLLNLKKLVASGKLLKVKASFKLPPRYLSHRNLLRSSVQNRILI